MFETTLESRRWRHSALAPFVVGAVFVTALVLALLAAGPTWGSVVSPEEEDRMERDALIRKLTGGEGSGFLDPVSTPAGSNALGQCIQWGDTFYTMPMELTEAQARSFVESLPSVRDRRYQPSGAYWVRTATNGNVSVPGQRITLTWSFVPDGTMIYESGGANLVPSNLFAIMNSRFASEEQWKDQFRRVFDEFGEIIGVNYVEVGDDGAAQGAVGLAGVRGDVRISMITMGRPGPLAFNYLPTRASQINSPFSGLGGDMVFNASYINELSQPGNQFRYLRNTTIHEHGHGLGYLHVDPINRTKIMEAFLVTNFDGMQEDDIRGFQNGYGDRFEVNTTPQTATPLGLLPTTPGEAPIFLENLAMETSAARDHFLVQAPAASILKISVEPIGTMYLQGAQNGPISNINAKEVHDLVVDVLTADGTTLLHTEDSLGLGGIEEFAHPLIMGPGEYIIRVRAKSFGTQSQRYQMRVSREQGSELATYAILNTLLDDSAGNASGAADPGERNVQLGIPLRNIGFSFGSPFGATLISETPTVTVTKAQANYGAAFPNEIAPTSDTFRINVSSSHVCGDPMVFRLVKNLNDGVQETQVELATGILGAGPFQSFGDAIAGPGSLSYIGASSHFVETDFPVGAIRLSNLNVTASNMGSHRFVLTNPEGLSIVLSDGGFKGSNLRGTTLADDGFPITAAVAPYPGTYRPTEPFVGLLGGSSQGLWRLSILNKTGGRAATIESWTLELAPFYEETFCAEVLSIPLDVIESMSVY